MGDDFAASEIVTMMKVIGSAPDERRQFRRRRAAAYSIESQAGYFHARASSRKERRGTCLPSAATFRKEAPHGASAALSTYMASMHDAATIAIIVIADDSPARYADATILGRQRSFPRARAFSYGHALPFPRAHEVTGFSSLSSFKVIITFTQARAGDACHRSYVRQQSFLTSAIMRAILARMAGSIIEIYIYRKSFYI